ncbi:hypothetical protein [Nocardia sp. NPDC049149]
MSNTTINEMTDFLEAVGDLRDADEAIRTTAHTSSIISEGWMAAEK